MLSKRNFALAFFAIAFIASRANAQTCTSYPNTLTNGTTADASQVMANFNCAALTGAASFTGNSTTTSGDFFGINFTGAQSAASSGAYIGLNLNPTYTEASGTQTTFEGERVLPESTGGAITDFYGSVVQPENNGAGAIQSFYGLWALPENTSTGAITTMRGVYAEPQNTSSGTVTTVYGVESIPKDTGAGAITNFYGVYSVPELSSSSSMTVTLMTALYGNCQNSDSSATVTTCYELYLDNPTTTGPITTTWGIYQRYSSALNYFAGDVGIGTGSPSYLLQVGSSSASGAVAELQNSSGACTHTPSSSSETVSCSSDARLKKDIADAKDVLPEFDTMRVRDFTVRATGERKTGVIAQEMLNVHPDMVHRGADGFYKVDEPNPWKLVKAIQELKARNDAQADALSTLKSENAALKQSLVEIGRRLSALESGNAVKSATYERQEVHAIGTRKGG